MQTFLGLPSADIQHLTAGSIAILGATDATPYEPGKASHSKDGPTAMRAASQKFAGWHEHYDFDMTTRLVDFPKNSVVDVGDVDCAPETPERNRKNIQAAVSGILAANARPLILGGDDSVPIPVLSAYERHGPIWVVQIDAHMDWREERFGERLGWSSPMRRASEMQWVAGMAQIGIRGVGSALAGVIKDRHRRWCGEFHWPGIPTRLHGDQQRANAR